MLYVCLLVKKVKFGEQTLTGTIIFFVELRNSIHIYFATFLATPTAFFKVVETTTTS